MDRFWRIVQKVREALHHLHTKKRRNMLRLYATLITALLTSVFLYVWISWPTNILPPKEISYSDFVAKAEHNEITNVKIAIVNTVDTGGAIKISIANLRAKVRGGGEITVHFEGAIPETMELLKNHTISYSFVYSIDEPLSPLAFLEPALCVAAMIGLYLYFLKWGIGQKGEIRLKFWHIWKKKKENRETTKFADVAGIDEVKADLQEIVDFLKGKRKKKMPKGTLLVGPPGVGKTLLARAVAGEADVPFHFAKGSDFVEMFVGVGASRIRALFNRAKQETPCVIFIDEIDAVAAQRIANPIGGQSEYQHATTELLGQMDGFEQNEGIHVIAATNNPEGIDEAIKRPGRFDRQIVVPLPDSKGREQILRVHTRKMELAEDVDFTELALGTPGFSGADLANLSQEADLAAEREGCEKVHMRHLVAQRDKVWMGGVRSSMAVSEKDKWLVAVHEVGHAIVALSTEGADPIEKISCMPRAKGSGGVTIQLPTEDRNHYPKSFLVGKLRILMGGRAAEEIFFEGDISAGAAQDIEQATAIASNMVCMWGMSEKIGPIQLKKRAGGQFLNRSDVGSYDCSTALASRADGEILTFVQGALDVARDIIKKKKDIVQRVSEELVTRKELTGKEIQLLIEGKMLLNG